MSLLQIPGFADRFDRAPDMIFRDVFSSRKFNIISNSTTADLDRKIMNDHFVLVELIASQVYSRKYRAGLVLGRGMSLMGDGTEILGEKLSKERLVSEMNDDWRSKLGSGRNNWDIISVPSESPVVRHSEIVASEVVLKIDALIDLQKKYPGLEKEDPGRRASLVYTRPIFKVLSNGKIGPVGSLPAAASLTSIINTEGLRQAAAYNTAQAASNAAVQSSASNALANAVTAQTQSARGSSGATPVAPPKPSRPAPRKPLPKPKRRR